MRIFFLSIAIILFICCKSNNYDLIPKQKIVSESLLLHQSKLTVDSVFVDIKNNFSCAIYFFSENFKFDSILKINNKSKINPNSSSLMKFQIETFNNFKFSPINPEILSVSMPGINLPFKNGKAYKILQGFNGNHSHNKLNNRYSIDFKMPSNDTICSVDDGLVIEAISGYKHGGKSDNWKGYDNYLKVYHPKLNLISVYAHLKFNGILVKIGDEIKAGQPIGLSGNTGYSTEPHLHFHLLKLNKENMWESVPYSFKVGYNAFDFKSGMIVKN